MSEAVLETIGLAKSFEQAGARIDVLTGVDLAVAPGEIVRATVKDASRDQLLDAILGPLDLRWRIADGRLEVTVAPE